MPDHALADYGWDRTRGAVFLRCACGFEDAFYPSDPAWYDQRLIAEEAEQVARFRRHLQEAGRG